MPRNKNTNKPATKLSTKTSKTTKAKRTNASTKAISQYQTLEKEFLAIPAKFASQIKKDIAAQKQKSNKLKATWTKTKKALKLVEAKLKLAEKNKSKKAIASAKKLHTKASDAFNKINTQFVEANAIIGALKAKHTKLNALSQCLVQFNKDWAKNDATAAIVEPKLVKKSTKASKKRKAKIIPLESAKTLVDDHLDENVENDYNSDVQVDEAAA